MTQSTPRARTNKARLFARSATLKDIPGILGLTLKVYPHMPSYREDQILGQINNFPEGQFVAEFDGKIVGYSASFRISGDIALKDHSWKEISGTGYGSRHDPNGDYLYGFEVCVDPDLRGLRVGRRLYEARKGLCQYLHLKGIIIVGRLPHLKKHISKVTTPEEYIKRVRAKKIRDRVFLFQSRNGFELERVIPNYLPTDEESLGYGALMVWRNPKAIESKRPGAEQMTQALAKTTVRISVVQYQQRRVTSFEEFLTFVEYFIDVAAGYEADFVVFPEWFTLQLLSIDNEKIPPAEGIFSLAQYTPKYEKVMQDYAIRFNINIIGGSTAVINAENQIQNCAFVFLRDGRVYRQFKIHPTPNERYWWNLHGGNKVQAIDTDCGPIGVLICYDVEFPEIVRHLVDQGMRILFVPFCTDERKSYLRVRYCAQARAIENQIFVAMSGNVGNLPRVKNMDIQYAQSCILTPCDFPFARDGIAADTTPNVETVTFADLHIDDLMRARAQGTVQNLRDRRHDLYQLTWTGE